jgi:hypothetical protein
MNITENGLMMFYDNLEQQKTNNLNNLRNGANRNDNSKDKLTEQEINIITNIQLNILKLKKIMNKKSNC